MDDDKRTLTEMADAYRSPPDGQRKRAAARAALAAMPTAERKAQKRDGLLALGLMKRTLRAFRAGRDPDERDMRALAKTERRAAARIRKAREHSARGRGPAGLRRRK
jgi:hypothetical protein